jgi:hypothetical protein
MATGAAHSQDDSFELDFAFAGSSSLGNKPHSTQYSLASAGFDRSRSPKKIQRSIHVCLFNTKLEAFGTVCVLLLIFARNDSGKAMIVRGEMSENHLCLTRKVCSFVDFVLGLHIFVSHIVLHSNDVSLVVKTKAKKVRSDRGCVTSALMFM